jgi:hypothetical protein
VTAWDDYLSTIGELDVVRRNAAAAVASQEQAAQAARVELVTVRQRIVLQRTRLSDVARRAGRPAPDVMPHAGDQATAATLVSAAVMDPTPGASAALKGAWATLDAADATLTLAAETPAGAGLLPSWPTTGRNVLPYAWYALLALIALVFINAFAGASPSARFVAFLFDLAVPFGAFLLGVASISLLFAPDRNGRKPKSMLLGVVICAIPLVIGVGLSVL